MMVACDQMENQTRVAYGDVVEGGEHVHIHQQYESHWMALGTEKQLIHLKVAFSNHMFPES